jgi:hypothetical protein
MNELGLKSQFKNITIKVGSQLYHIWSNVLGNESKLGVLQTYWSNFHKTNLYGIQTTKHIFNF